MPIVTKAQHSLPKVTDVALAVSVENQMDIRVAAGTFKIARTDYALADDNVHTVTADPTDPTDVHGYLVRDKASGDIELLVDEAVLDGLGEAYWFSGGPKEQLYRLFTIRVPAGSTDISGETLNVWTTVQPTAEAGGPGAHPSRRN